MIYLINRIDNNPGDLWSSPRHYFEFGDHISLDILDTDKINKIPDGSRCILGGGGLFKQTFLPNISILLKKKCKIVFWGIGERYLQNVDSGWIDKNKKSRINIEVFNPSLHLLSMRSLEPGIEWVPCASCNHPIFNRTNKIQPKCDIGILSHKRVLIPNKYSFKEMQNDPASLEDLIEFINDCSILITNSYHGMYWAFLLGVTTICVPFSSGHYKFNGKINYAKPNEALDEAIKLLKNNKQALSHRYDISYKRLTIHRNKSTAFHKRACDFLNS